MEASNKKIEVFKKIEKSLIFKEEKLNDEEIEIIKQNGNFSMIIEELSLIKNIPLASFYDSLKLSDSIIRFKR